MENRVFGAMASAFFDAASNLFSFSSEVVWLFRLFFWIIALVYGACLAVCGIVFGILIILDFLGEIVDNIREFVAELMGDISDNTDDSFLSFLLNPIFVVLLAPIFFMTLLIPKLSSETYDFDEQDLPGMIFSGGSFRKAGTILFRTCETMFSYLGDVFWLFKPIVLTITLLYSFVLLSLALCFFILVPLDWISSIIDSIRKRIIDASNWLSDSCRDNFIGFIFSPVVLVVAAPFFLAILLIPKISGTPMDLDVT